MTVGPLRLNRPGECTDSILMNTMLRHLTHDANSKSPPIRPAAGCVSTRRAVCCRTNRFNWRSLP